MMVANYVFFCVAGIAKKVHKILFFLKFMFIGRNQSQVAGFYGVSLCHLIGLYRREYGEPPMRNLKRLRLEEVSRLLRETDLAITEIAYSQCFSSSQHLSRDFRKATGFCLSWVKVSIESSILIKIHSSDRARALQRPRRLAMLQSTMRSASSWLPGSSLIRAMRQFSK